MEGGIFTIENTSNVQAIPVATTSVVYTKSFKMARSDAFSIFTKCAGSAPSVKIELEQGLVRPTTEGSADTTNYAEPDGMPDVGVINDTNLHVKQLSPIPCVYGRFKITGLAGNGADTTVTMSMFMQGGF